VSVVFDLDGSVNSGGQSKVLLDGAVGSATLRTGAFTLRFRGTAPLFDDISVYGVLRGRYLLSLNDRQNVSCCTAPTITTLFILTL